MSSASSFLEDFGQAFGVTSNLPGIETLQTANFFALSGLRGMTFSRMWKQHPEEEPDDENGGDPLKSRIGAYFARAEEPSEDDPSPATSPELYSDSEVVSIRW